MKIYSFKVGHCLIFSNPVVGCKSLRDDCKDPKNCENLHFLILFRGKSVKNFLLKFFAGICEISQDLTEFSRFDFSESNP